MADGADEDAAPERSREASSPLSTPPQSRSNSRPLSPGPLDLIIQYSDIQLQHMRHNAVITVGDAHLTDMLEAFEAIRKLPEEQQYKKFTQFNVWAEAQKSRADTLTEMAMVLILRDSLHIKAQVTTKQMKLDNEKVLTRVEKCREQRQKAIDKIRQYWGHSHKGISFATILVMSYGTKFHNELSKLARIAKPDEVLEMVNGELIRRLTSNPKPGVRVNRHLMPSEFKKAIKILDKDLPDTAYEWDDEERRRLGLQYNMVGMLGEASADYSEDVPPVGDSVIEFMEIPAPPPNEEVLVNLERWAKLGLVVVNEDSEPLEECLMDKVVLRQGAHPENNKGNIIQSGACGCDEETLGAKDWFLALKEKYVAKQIGWMAMATLVNQMPDGICGYHLRQLAGVLGIKATRVNRDELIKRLRFVFKHRGRIDDIIIKDEFFHWFKASALVSTERKKRLLGVLKFHPIKRDVSKPKIAQRASVDLTDIHKLGAYEPKEEDKVIHIASKPYWRLMQHSVRMYCHHNRYEKKGLGFAHHCYYSPMQQACRQDLKLWWNVAKQRMDQEFRLITIPFPAVIIQNDEEFNHSFVHGDAKELYAKNNFKHADHLTAYVIHSAIGNLDRSEYGVEHGRLRAGSEESLAWRDLAAEAFGSHSGMFETGYFQDVTSKSKCLGYTKLIKSDHVTAMNNKSWALIPGGNPVTFKPSVSGTKSMPFAASIIPYTAVKRLTDGTVDPLLENGMRYQDVRNAHRDLEPIFDKNVTNDGQYEILGFPVECHLITQNPVEQALVGRLSWDDQSVLNEAAKLLGMDEAAFDEWYTSHGKDVEASYLRVFQDSISVEKGYGEKSYYKVVEDSGKKGGKRRTYAEADDDGDIESIPTDDDDKGGDPGPDHGKGKQLQGSTPSGKKPRRLGAGSREGFPETPRTSRKSQAHLTSARRSSRNAKIGPGAGS